jgi:hypothetical protein
MEMNRAIILAVRKQVKRLVSVAVSNPPPSGLRNKHEAYILNNANPHVFGNLKAG